MEGGGLDKKDHLPGYSE